jgi:hypothetical protein
VGDGRPGRTARHRSRRARRAAGVRQRAVASTACRRARRAAAPTRRPHRQQRGRTGPPRHDGHGQADQPVPRQGHPARRVQLPVLRGLRTARRRRVDADGDRPPRLHALRAGRRDRGDRSVELPTHARDVEDRPGPRLRQHGRAQTGGAVACFGAATRRAGSGGRHPAGCPERGPWVRAPRGRRGTDAARRRRPDHVHGRVEHRTGDPGGGRAVSEACELRDGWQGGERGVRRRRPRRLRRLVDQGDLHERRPGVPRGLPPVRRTVAVRRLPGALRGRRRWHATG